MTRGAVVWLTGLPGSGKTTLAHALRARLQPDRTVEVLDGDELRRTISRDLGFSKADRDEHVRRVAALAAENADTGAVAIVALISPYRQARDAARREISARHCFVEVHLDCSVDELRRRDPKGLYRRAAAGEIQQFTGVSDPYEAPLHPELRIDTSSVSVEAAVNALHRALAQTCHEVAAPR